MILLVYNKKLLGESANTTNSRQFSLFFFMIICDDDDADADDDDDDDVGRGSRFNFLIHFNDHFYLMY